MSIIGTVSSICFENEMFINFILKEEGNSNLYIVSALKRAFNISCGDKCRVKVKFDVRVRYKEECVLYNQILKLEEYKAI